MDRITATKLTRETLDKFGLTNWGVSVTTDPRHSFLGMCSYKDKKIILNSHHIDIHPEKEIYNTILHEVAHALCPGNGHGDMWVTKAKEIGCTNTLPCSHLNFPEHVIDAIRSGQMVEMTVEEETHVIHRPKFTVTRLQDYCPFCLKDGKKTVAKEKFSIDGTNKNGDVIKMITLECFHVITKVLPKATPYETMVSNFWKPEVAACKHDWVKNVCMGCGEFKLFNFQITGAMFTEVALASQKGAGIFDDMGLGKTVQALAILRFHGTRFKPTMIVTKSAIKFQWFKEAVKWLGPEYIAQIISTSRDYLMPGLNLYIIPYDLLRRFKREKLHSLNVKLVILDEVQQIKNPDSSRTQEVRKLVSSNPECKVIELSGTPWKNRGSEFFPALNLLDPIKFYSYQAYLDSWVDFYWEGNKKKMGGIRRPEKFKEYVSGIIIRREYNEVMEEFPDINRMKLNVQLDELSQTTYDDSVSEFVEWYNEAVIGGEEDKIGGIELLAKMARMRHITGLAKIPATLTFIEEFIEETERKLVVFHHHIDVGVLMVNALTDINKASNPDWYELAQTLKEQDIKVMHYTSHHTGRPEGYQIQDDFNNSKRCILIASTQACGEGINLQTCADSIMHERQWNPQNEDQAAPGRFRRIGQVSKVVNITFPEAEGTIDAHLDALVSQKRRQFHVVMNKGEVPTWNQTEFAKQLAELIVSKHRAKKVKSGKANGKSITTAASF